MCVILVCPPQVRPDLDVLKACHAANPHGAGIGWRQDGAVHWKKNLGPEQLAGLIGKLEGEIVLHFRWASVGGVDPRLCHPFPVDRGASTKLEGKAGRLLFHNGTWGGHKSALEFIEKRQDRTISRPISDTRVIALLVDMLRDDSTLEHIDGRFVLYTPKRTKLYGQWRKWRGMQTSNLGFVYELERAERRARWADADDGEQLALWSEGGEEVAS
ncbi:MAG: hypothetical protein IAE97_06795 [Chthoniobacterales bacterium]|nr:hypothetical protein [Chthoniobacterales bacterium]